MSDRIIPKRLGYSCLPWRLVLESTGQEVGRPTMFDHPNLGPMPLIEYGFNTKAEAVAYLGEMALRALDRRPEEPA